MTAAAAELGLSPAMIGQHVAALELRLGARLLNRTTRRQSVTDFGLSYYDNCCDILERVASTFRAAESVQKEPRGKLRITAPTTFGTEVLVPALGKYSDGAPEVTLDLILTDLNVDLVQKGFDIAFRIGTLPDSRLIARRLCGYRMMICAAPHYITRKGEPRHPLELSGHEAISFTPVTRASWRLWKNKEMVEVTPLRRITVNSGHAVRNAARAGLGIVMQPAILMRPEVTAGRLVELLPDWRSGERPLSLVYSRDQHMGPRIRSFISFAVKEFGSPSSDRLL